MRPARHSVSCITVYGADASRKGNLSRSGAVFANSLVRIPHQLNQCIFFSSSYNFNWHSCWGKFKNI